MTKRGKYLELRPFSGRTLDSALSYLRVDLQKAFSDLFAILAQPKPVQTIAAVVVDTQAGSSTSGDIFQMAKLVLPGGIWHITGTASLDGTENARVMTTSSVWMTLLGPTAAGGNTPSDNLRGYNRSLVNPGSGDTFDVINHTCQWVLELKGKTTIFMEGSALFSGGADNIEYRCAMVAHGYVMG